MLSGVKKITIEEKSVINGAEIAGFRAVFSDAKDITFLPYQINKEACKDYAYNLEEMFGEMKGESAE